MKTHLLITLLLVFTLLPAFSQGLSKPGAGVTIIVHGWNPDGSQPAWIDKMADAIIARSGGVGHIGTITVSGSSANLTATCSNWNFDMASANAGEIVILVNWTAVSNHLTTFTTAQSVAAVVAPKIYQPQNSQPALSELPIHLIGHSRGGGMIFEIARLLGLQGIEVEQVTALDPHPLTEADPQPLMGTHTLDTPVKVHENILFVDNYYQNIKFPTGQYINGAYNRLWTSLPGGYHNESGYTYNIILANYDFSDHLNIILAYHGTINLATPVTNGQATMNTTERTWFNTVENAGENTGFSYSAMGMGNRKSANIPVAGGDAVMAGFNNNSLLGGTGVRQSLTWTNAVWPNIITASIFRNSAELLTTALTVAANEVLQLNYNYRSNANPCVVTFYIDMDRNPYNNNNVATIGTQNWSATGTTLTQSTLNWTVNGLSDGTKYYVCAKITDGIHTRFLYPNYEITCSTNHAGFENISEQNSISIYPNPTNGLLNIDVEISIKPLSVKVFDLVGNLIIEKTIQNKGHTQLDVSNLKNAMYLIKADNTSQLKTCKLIKY